MSQNTHTDTNVFDGQIARFGHNLYAGRKTRTSKGQYIYRRHLITADVRHASQMLLMRKAAGGYGDGIRLNLGRPNGCDAIERPGQFKAAAAGKQRAKRHSLTSMSSKSTGTCAFISASYRFIYRFISGYTPFPVRRARICRHSRILAFMTMRVAVELGSTFRASCALQPMSSMS